MTSPAWNFIERRRWVSLSPLRLTARLAALHLERLRRAAYDPFDPRVIASAPFPATRKPAMVSTPLGLRLTT